MCQVPKSSGNSSGDASGSQPGPSGEPTAETNGSASVVPDDIYSYYEKIDQDDDEETELKTVSFEIDQDHLETLQKRLVVAQCVNLFVVCTHLQVTSFLG